MAAQLTAAGISFDFSRATYKHFPEYDVVIDLGKSDPVNASDPGAAVDVILYLLGDCSQAKGFMDAHKEASEDYLIANVDYFMGSEFWTNETNDCQVFIIHWFSSFDRYGTLVILTKMKNKFVKIC